ncbi:hypothetical protein GCM10023187_53170 [Nibrella viscosa]|uniref:Transposase n=1 Tax=Nibrella viscosa TaxID=1084524 RepID=A0ABP8L060_9BACT
MASLQQKLETESALRAEFDDFKQMVMTLLAQKTPGKRKTKP